VVFIDIALSGMAACGIAGALLLRLSPIAGALALKQASVALLVFCYLVLPATGRFCSMDSGGGGEAESQSVIMERSDRMRVLLPVFSAAA
jgi:hypothetical protein